jgi:hypothetical protein
VEKLQVDTNDLRDTAKDLEAVIHEFKDADKNSAKLADAVGHPGLANHITSFSMNWTQKRADMVKDIEELHKKVLEGADKLDEADSRLAAGLTSPPPKSTTQAAPHGATTHGNGGPQ